MILFLDSDVLPETGWLRHLLATFEDPKVQVAVGNASVDLTSLYGRIFALAWYFPPRSADGPPAVSRTSMVNNLAMRRGVFDRYPFPGDSSLYIAQCTDWAETLRVNGIDIYLNPSARVVTARARIAVARRQVGLSPAAVPLALGLGSTGRCGPWPKRCPAGIPK